MAQGARCILTWPQLIEWCQSPALRAPSKAELPLIKLATFAGDRRSDATLEQVYGIEGDYDAGQVQPAIAAARLADAGICGLIYTTPSHRPDTPRWRVLCALSRPFGPTDRHGHVARLNGALGGILAPESFTASQAFYVGAVDNGEPVHVLRLAARTSIPSTELNRSARRNHRAIGNRWAVCQLWRANASKQH